MQCTVSNIWVDKFSKSTPSKTDNFAFPRNTAASDEPRHDPSNIFSEPVKQGKNWHSNALAVVTSNNTQQPNKKAGQDSSNSDERITGTANAHNPGKAGQSGQAFYFSMVGYRKLLFFCNSSSVFITGRAFNREHESRNGDVSPTACANRNFSFLPTLTHSV